MLERGICIGPVQGRRPAEILSGSRQIEHDARRHVVAGRLGSIDVEDRTVINVVRELQARGGKIRRDEKSGPKVISDTTTTNDQRCLDRLGNAARTEEAKQRLTYRPP